MFDPKEKITQIKGKDYLEVKWRIVWFRDEHPKGSILTEIASTDPLIIKAIITDNDGVRLASGLGSPKTQGVSAGRPFEGAETAAIGRALAHAGYGTQFTGEDEGEHLADAPVDNAWSKEHIKAVMDATDKIDNPAHAKNWLNLVKPKTVPHIKVLMPKYTEYKEQGKSPEEAAEAVQSLNV